MIIYLYYKHLEFVKVISSIIAFLSPYSRASHPLDGAAAELNVFGMRRMFLVSSQLLPLPRAPPCYRRRVVLCDGVPGLL